MTGYADVTTGSKVYFLGITYVVGAVVLFCGVEWHSDGKANSAAFSFVLPSVWFRATTTNIIGACQRVTRVDNQNKE